MVTRIEGYKELGEVVRIERSNHMTVSAVIDRIVHLLDCGFTFIAVCADDRPAADLIEEIRKTKKD